MQKNEVAHNRKDYTDKTFNNLKVVSVTKSGSNGAHTRWECRCLDCGRIRDLKSSDLSTSRCHCGFQGINDLTGQQFGFLKVLRRHSIIDHSVYWVCVCSLDNNEKIAKGSYLTSGKTKSCGCLQKPYKTDKYPHGVYSTLLTKKIFGVYRGIIDRCYNPKAVSYPNYGGRGIRMCEEWLYDFWIFYEWVIINGYERGLQIDRINNDGDYEPSNCRFVTRKENMRNRSDNHWVIYQGIRMTLTEAWERAGRIPTFKTASTRITKLHWDAYKAVSTPSRKWSNA